MIKLCLTCLLFLMVISLPSSQAVSPDDEEYTGNESLELFLTELERHTGLAALTPNYTLTVSCSNPEVTECTVNPNGTIIWDVSTCPRITSRVRLILAEERRQMTDLCQLIKQSIQAQAEQILITERNIRDNFHSENGAQLYAEHMMENFKNETNKKITLDGCLKYNSGNVTSYISCMQQVRKSMITFLGSEFDSRFKSVLEGDCSLSTGNCV